jgi:hypothetical protein
MKKIYSNKHLSYIGIIFLSIAITTPALFAQQVTSPEEFFGHKVGADYHLINYKQAVDYWKELEQQSAKMKLFPYGKTSYGRTMLLAVVSSEANMANLERYKEISQRLALVRGLADEEAQRLAAEGKAIVWIDGGLHASEVAPAQHILQLTYDMLSDNSSKTARILDEVITMLVLPNPDGMDMVSEWYNSNVGTPYETSRMPWLYQKYIGHDNNRDSFMMSVAETQNMNQVVNHEWYPQIFYNHHQTGPFPSLIFVPPDCEPTNPNLHPLLLRWQTFLGGAMAKAFELEKKLGVTSRFRYDTWYPGYVTQVADFHNIISTFSETQLYRWATPHFYTINDFPEPFKDLTLSIFHTSPWRGGWWRLRDAVEYCLTASKAVLNLAAKHREELLYIKYWMGKDNIDKFQKESPYGWMVPKEQKDPAATAQLLNNLIALDIEIYQTQDSFTSDGITYPRGTYVLPTSQPFGRFLKTMFEIQHYPDLRKYPMLWQSINRPLDLKDKVPPIRSYDVVGWTLPLQMGVNSIAMNTPVDVEMERIKTVDIIKGGITSSGNYAFVIPPENSNTFIAINRLLQTGADVLRAKGEFKAGGETFSPGTVIVPVSRFSVTKMKALAEELSLPVMRINSRPSGGTYAVQLPRIGLYKTWVANMDEGWTRLVLENYEFPYTTIHNADMRAGRLGERFDVVILPNQSADSIINGHKPGTMPQKYVGGIAAEGVRNLRDFVEKGGTLITMGAACDLPTEELRVPVKNMLKSLKPEQFFASGLLVKMVVDPSNPLAYGMGDEAVGFFSNSPTFSIMPSFKEETKPVVVARYPEENIMLSGWMVGEKYLSNKAAVVEVPVGKGKIILLGLRVQHRGQPVGTFKLLFNSIFYAKLK